MSDQRITYLLKGWTSRKLTPEEEKELFDWITDNPDQSPIHAHVQQLVEQYDRNDLVPAVEWESLYERILDKREKPVVHRVNRTGRNWFRIAAAAAVLAIITTTAIVLLTNNKKPDQTLANSNKHLSNDAIPAKEGAILTLANGRQVVLDSMGNGIVTTQGKTTVLISNGQLVYNAGTTESEILYNTMTTPKGRQYQLVLPDGTAVWLNAASSITYPTAFVGKNRNVSITGEAYFEVTKDKTKPFQVKVNNMEVEVLGTHFNINSYADEASIKTTLLEGSVRVIKGNDMAMLKPGQQAQINTTTVAMSSGRQQSNTAGITVINNANLDQEMAWKNGSFQFDGVPLSAVMRQLSRWYDVEIVYEKGVPDINLGGEMKRDLNLSQVLKGLGKMGVNFRIEGKKLVVLP